mmetsp:Transcript_1278/g.3830  ORF Transcript_1278/g.3830 Transcript_1278/m.3830 type:complete len:220 (+) Transcript_1278:2575-3234(+)
MSTTKRCARPDSTRSVRRATARRTWAAASASTSTSCTTRIRRCHATLCTLGSTPTAWHTRASLLAPASRAMSCDHSANSTRTTSCRCTFVCANRTFCARQRAGGSSGSSTLSTLRSYGSLSSSPISFSGMAHPPTCCSRSTRTAIVRRSTASCATILTRGGLGRRRVLAGTGTASTSLSSPKSLWGTAATCFCADCCQAEYTTSPSSTTRRCQSCTGSH